MRVDYFYFSATIIPQFKGIGEVAEMVESGTLLMCYAALKPHPGFESLPLRTDKTSRLNRDVCDLKIVVEVVY